MLVGGKRFCHVRWLSDDPAVATIMNLERVRGEDALPRLAKGMSVEQMRAWLQQPQTELYAALPDHFIADWDSTVNTRYGHQEDAALGYNPHKRGRKSHHPLICVAARTRLCLHLEWRPGDTVSATDWQPAMEKLWRHPTIRQRLWLNRGDAGFGQEAILAWHEQAGEQRPRYLFKLRLTTNVRRAIARVPWPLREGAPTPGHHREAVTSRRDSLFLAARVVQSGRQRVVKLAVKAERWEVLKACYQRLRTWLAATAPQLEATGAFLRRLARLMTAPPDETLPHPASG